MKRIGAFFLCLVFLAAPVKAADQPVWDLLSESERALLTRILAHWETWVPARQKDGTAPLLTYEELYQGLDAEARDFLERVRHVDPKKDFGFTGDYLGESAEGVKIVRIDDQWMEKDGKPKKLDPQYLPENVYKAYQDMAAAMQKDLGKKLLIESGYRSPAYQLYTFLFYTPKHGYSLSETGKWVAIPGYSEHGAPAHQAIDFINEKAVNGEDRVEDFEELPEYAWLLKHAGDFGFMLSYPRNQPGITFEPWHWRYTASVQAVQTENR